MVKMSSGLGIGIVAGTSFPLTANAGGKNFYKGPILAQAAKNGYSGNCTCRCRTNCRKGCGCICHGSTIESSTGESDLELASDDVPTWDGLDNLYSSGVSQNSTQGTYRVFQNNFSYYNWP